MLSAVLSSPSLQRLVLTLIFISSLASAQLDSSFASINRRSHHGHVAAAKRMVVARRPLSSSDSSSSSFSTPSVPVAVARGNGGNDTLPTGWFMTHACVTDSPAPNRLLNDGMDYGPTMTPGECLAACDHDGYTHAGVQYGGECWCGNSIHVNGTDRPMLGWDKKISAEEDTEIPSAAQAGYNADVSKCNAPCNGDNSLMCGGWWHMTLYWKEDDCVDEDEDWKNWKGWKDFKGWMESKGWKDWKGWNEWKGWPDSHGWAANQ